MKRRKSSKSHRQNIILYLFRKYHKKIIAIIFLLVIIYFSVSAINTKNRLKNKAAELINNSISSIPTVTNLYYQNWSYDPQAVINLPSYYAAFISDYILGKSYRYMGKYVESTTAMPRGSLPEGYPIIYEDMKQNELAFVHSTNPAELTTVFSGDFVRIFWKYDERFPANFQDLSYNVYRLKNTYIDTKKLWDQSWKDLSWEKIATVNAISSDISGKFMSYIDNGYSTNGNTCYLIKTLSGQNESIYSLPLCKNYLQESPPAYFYFTHSDIKLVDKTPSDSLYSNNTYSIKVNLQKWGDFNYAQLVLYGNDGGFKVTDNQYAYNFHEIEAFPLEIQTEGQTGKIESTITLKRPYLLYKRGSGYTEEPVFRIRAMYGGHTKEFPADGGYLTLWDNNKLSQRFWTGHPANPASIEWQAKMISVANNLKIDGYNAIFLDNWAPRLFDILSAGSTFDCPTVEFYYPQNWQTIPGFTDPTVLAFDLLGQAIKKSIPSMTLIGNSLNTDTASSRILQSIDFGMFEGCIHGGKDKIVGDQLNKTFAVLESALNMGKKVVCFSTYTDNGPSEISPLDPEHRTYTLASYLLVMDSQTRGRSYYGHAMLPPSWGNSINQFPEYLLDLGNPTEARQSIGSYVWKRKYSNGMVYVNAGTTNKIISTSFNTNKVIIDNVILNRNSSYAIHNSNPGIISYESINRGTNITLSPGTGIIFVDTINTISTPTPSQTITPTYTPNPTPTQTACIPINQKCSTSKFTKSMKCCNGLICSRGRCVRNRPILNNNESNFSKWIKEK